MSTSEYYDNYWRGLQQGDGWQLQPMVRDLFNRYVTSATRVLDAACGDGQHYGLHLASRAKEYLGLDISEAALHGAEAAGLKVRRQDFDMPFAELPQFDVVVACEIIEHLPHPERLLSSLRDSVRPGGVLLASVPNVAYWRRRVRLLLGRFNPDGHPDTAWAAPWRDPHVRFYTAEAFGRLLKQHGFTVEQIVGTAGVRFGMKLRPQLFARHLMAVARRCA